jgi:hypothetical protein
MEKVRKAEFESHAPSSETVAQCGKQFYCTVLKSVGVSTLFKFILFMLILTDVKVGQLTLVHLILGVLGSRTSADEISCIELCFLCCCGVVKINHFLPHIHVLIYLSTIHSTLFSLSCW